MKKLNNKIATAFVVLAAGSVFFGSVPANAKVVDLNTVNTNGSYVSEHEILYEYYPIPRRHRHRRIRPPFRAREIRRGHPRHHRKMSFREFRNFERHDRRINRKVAKDLYRRERIEKLGHIGKRRGRR